MSRSTSAAIPRRRRAAAVGAFAVAAAFAPPASAANDTLQWSKATRCDEIFGNTLAINARWRVVEVAPRAAPIRTTLVACDRRENGAVGQLGTAREFLYGPVPYVRGIAGDRVLVEYVSTSSGGTTRKQSLIDLRTGARRDLEQGSGSADGKYTRVLAALTGRGAFATAVWSGTEETPGTGGSLTTFTSSGATVTPTIITELMPSQTGVYYTAADGRPGHLDLAGPVGATDLTSGASPTATRMALTRVPRKTGVTRTPLHGADGVLSVFTLISEQRKTKRVDAIEVRPAVKVKGVTATRKVSLAPGGAGDLNVLAHGPTGILVAARFADAPKQRRIRSIGADPADTSFTKVDIKSSPSAELPGHAAWSTTGTIAIANGDKLQRFGPAAGTRNVPGIRDLAPISDFTPGFFFTRGDGIVERLPLSR